VCADPALKCIHVFVALCDNKYQGIVPVPAKIGNGQDPDNNLYWGSGFGVRTFFKKSKDWKLIRAEKLNKKVLERLVFRHVSKKYYLVADAYDGEFIKQTTTDFLYSCAGQLKDTLHIDGGILGINGNAGLLAYIGHDGLMDFQLPGSFQNKDHVVRKCIILACVSKNYFDSFVKSSKAYPLVWTTGLMCPEAYTLHAAIAGYINNESGESIRMLAAGAYDKYQKCGIPFSKRLLVTGN